MDVNTDTEAVLGACITTLFGFLFSDPAGEIISTQTSISYSVGELLWLALTILVAISLLVK